VTRRPPHRERYHVLISLKDWKRTSRSLSCFSYSTSSSLRLVKFQPQDHTTNTEHLGRLHHSPTFRPTQSHRRLHCQHLPTPTSPPASSRNQSPPQAGTSATPPAPAPAGSRPSPQASAPSSTGPRRPTPAPRARTSCSASSASRTSART
jgi:hypothetical protein